MKNERTDQISFQLPFSKRALGVRITTSKDEREALKVVAFGVLLVLAALALSGCTPNNFKQSGEVARSGSGEPVYVYEIDGCEYIGYIGGRTSWASHKGNCKFCAERNKRP